MFNSLEDMKNINIKSADIKDLKSLCQLEDIDLNTPLIERLRTIQGSLVNPYIFKSSQGTKVKISHSGIKTLDEALIEHFINNL